MAGEAQDNVWPLPSFYFKVELGSLGEIAFKEVSGLDMEAQVIEYRHGNSPVFSNIKMPTLSMTSCLRLKTKNPLRRNKSICRSLSRSRHP